MKLYEYTLKAGITRTKEFERKRLATHAVNVGLKCGHGCTYCSSSTMLRMHRGFRDVGRSPFEAGYAIVDPDTVERVRRDAHRIRKRGMVQLCTTTDAWSPEAQKYDLGRRCLEAILSEPGWTVRVLTKSAAVREDFDLIARHRDRVLVGLSITAPPCEERVIAAVEPHASSISERIAALREAHDLGLRTYVMFCPLLPKLGFTARYIAQLVQLAGECGVEEIFSEPFNPRGAAQRATEQALLHCQDALEASMALIEARAREDWSCYVVGLTKELQRSVRAYSDIDRLRILLYPARLTPRDVAEIRRDDAGVVWLGRPEHLDVVVPPDEPVTAAALGLNDGGDPERVVCPF